MANYELAIDIGQEKAGTVKQSDEYDNVQILDANGGWALFNAKAFPQLFKRVKALKEIRLRKVGELAGGKFVREGQIIRSTAVKDYDRHPPHVVECAHRLGVTVEVFEREDIYE